MSTEERFRDSLGDKKSVRRGGSPARLTWELCLRHREVRSLADWRARCSLQSSRSTHSRTVGQQNSPQRGSGAVRRGGLRCLGWVGKVHGIGEEPTPSRPGSVWCSVKLLGRGASSPVLCPHLYKHESLWTAASLADTHWCCYLWTMSLISFTELSSLLKSCVAAGPLEAVAGQICSSRRLLSSLLMASRKANLFLICWMEST